MGIKQFRIERALDLLKSVRDELLSPSLIQEPEEMAYPQRNGKSKRKLRVNIDDCQF